MQLDLNEKEIKEIKFENFSRIKIKNVDYKYETGEQVLKNVNFEINAKEKIGIIGSSGVGKSTLINILLGLLRPSSGEITIEGIDIFKNLRSWQKSLCYVPQDIYLFDETIKKNILLN